MVNLFVDLLNRSILAGWVILAVILLRLLLRKAPRKYICLLWILVAVRLICPFAVESRFSLLPDISLPVSVTGTAGSNAGSRMEVLQENVSAGAGTGNKTSVGETSLEETSTGATGEGEISTGELSVGNADAGKMHAAVAGGNVSSNSSGINSNSAVLRLLTWLWLAGVAGMLGYGIFMHFSLRRRIKATIPLEKDIYLCDDINTPFILGIVRPVIYLPSILEEFGRTYVIAHEKAHIIRKDHWWKPLGYVLLSIYWFQPLLWAAYVLLCKDIELACDERVIEAADEEYKKAYAGTLLACCVPGSSNLLSPLAFGEVGVKERIASIMNYKKPSFWTLLLTVAAGIFVAICLLTNSVEKETPVQEDDTQLKEDESEAGATTSLSYNEAVQKWYELRDYPVLPGSEEWKQYDFEKEIAICNPPEDLLKELTTQEVADLLLKYPLLSQYGGYDYIDFFFEFLQVNCNVYREIWNREGGIAALVKAYEKNEPDIDMLNQQNFVGFDTASNAETFIFQFFTFHQDRLRQEDLDLFLEAYQNKCERYYSKITSDKVKREWNFVATEKPDPDRSHKLYYIDDLLQWQDKWYELRNYPEPMKYAPSGYRGYSFDWDEYRELMNPPTDLLQEFSSVELADLLLRYYDITYYPDYKNVAELFDRLESKCDILKELLKREDGIHAVLKAYEANSFQEYPAGSLTESVLRDGHPTIMAELFACRFVDRYQDKFTQDDVALYQEIYQKKKVIYAEIPVSSAAVQFTTVFSK